LVVFDVVLCFVAPAATVFLAVDDTLARKRGLKIFGVGMHPDQLNRSAKVTFGWKERRSKSNWPELQNAVQALSAAHLC
jgi:hypothetical protein